MNRRTVLTVAAALLATIAPAAAQQVKVMPEGRPDPVLYEFKHLDNESAMAVTHLAQTMFSVTISWEPKLHTVVLYSGNREQLQKAADFVKRYDVPPPPEPQIRFIAYLIRAGEAPPLAGKSPQDAASPVPAQLDEVVAEMKKSFVYAHYALLDTVTSVSHGSAAAADILPGLPYAYSVDYGDVAVSPDRKGVNVRPFQFQLRNGGGAGKDSVISSISSNITIHEGQKLVLGKVRLPAYGSLPRADLFVVLTVKVE